uniref:U90-Liphistoxin-Lth1a_1 n=1 Tax=Liphistius thaleban TaxID=1905330 RepID=A0A4Q8K2T0_9ARAC
MKCASVLLLGAVILASTQGRTVMVKRDVFQFLEDPDQRLRVPNSRELLPEEHGIPLPLPVRTKRSPQAGSVREGGMSTQGNPRPFCDGFSTECVAPPGGKCPDGYRYDSRGQKCRKLSG